MEFQLKSFDLPLEVLRIANIHYFEFTGQYHTSGDFHNFCELLYVDKGEITVTAENYTGALADNQLIIHRPNEIHSLACPTNIAPNVIIIGFECFSEALMPFSKVPFTLTADQKKMLAEIMKEGMSVYAPPYDMPNLLDMKKRESYPFGADQMIKLRLESFLISLVRSLQKPDTSKTSSSKDGSKFPEVERYIAEHFREKILLDNICFLFGTNKTTLCQSFKQEHGMTIPDYCNNLKVREAKILLREGTLSVTEIAEKLGFNSIHYFCRLFKQKTGQSPKKYAQSIRSKLDL